MNLYLDIDGTLIHEELTDNNGRAAAGLENFLVAAKNYHLFWLTTHCRDGNPERPREILKKVTPESLHMIIDSIEPTIWDVSKTEGIDWSQDFIWLDDTITETEWLMFERASPNQQVIEMNLRENPNQLIEITADLLI